MKTAGNLLFDGARPGIKFALGENPKSIVLGPQTGPRRDLQLEPLVEVLEGRRLVHAHSCERPWGRKTGRESRRPPGALGD